MACYTHKVCSISLASLARQSGSDECLASTYCSWRQKEDGAGAETTIGWPKMGLVTTERREQGNDSNHRHCRQDAYDVSSYSMAASQPTLARIVPAATLLLVVNDVQISGTLTIRGCMVFTTIGGLIPAFAV